MVSRESIPKAVRWQIIAKNSTLASKSDNMVENGPLFSGLQIRGSARKGKI